MDLSITNASLEDIKELLLYLQQGVSKEKIISTVENELSEQRAASKAFEKLISKEAEEEMIEIDEEPEKVIQKTSNLNIHLNETISPSEEELKEIEKSIVSTVADAIKEDQAEKTRDCKEVQPGVLVTYSPEAVLDDPDFTEIKSVSGSEDNIPLEPLHLNEVKPKEFTRAEIYKLATDLSQAGKQVQLIEILNHYGVQSVPELKEKDYNAFGAELEAFQKVGVAVAN